MAINSEKQTWINPESGQTIEARMSLRRVERENFEILYLSYLLDLFDKLGGKKYQVFKYIIANKDYNNIVYITNRKLAEACGVSVYTVTETLKMLKAVGVIVTKTNLIMVNAKMMNNRKPEKEAYLIQKFELIEKENMENKKEDEPEQLLFDGCEKSA